MTWTGGGGLARFRLGVAGCALMLAVVLVTVAPPWPVEATPPPAAVPSWCERTATGYRCVVGPIPTPPGQMVELMTGVAAPSEAGYVTSAQANLVDSAGEEIAHHDVHLHHAVWLNPTRRDLTCDSYDDGLPGYERFFASGKERTTVELPNGYGYYWSNGLAQPHTESAPYWGFVAMLDGGSGHADTFVELDIDFVPEGEAQDMTAIRPVWLDVRNCRSHPVYDVEEGSGQDGVHRESWTHELALGGRFVFLGGHLHDGGLTLQLDNVTSGSHLFTSEARYDWGDHPWFLTGMTTMSDPAGPTVAAGDELRLTAAYDSSTDRDDAMGIMLGALVPARSAPPAAQDPAAGSGPQPHERHPQRHERHARSARLPKPVTPGPRAPLPPRRGWPATGPLGVAP